MPNPHYQRVLEQDAQLPAPLRWLTRAMSSWWTIGILAVLIVGYVASALVPLGERHAWQSRLIDKTQHEVLTWWPLQAAAVLLAAAVVWAALRRLPLRPANFGIFIAAIGLAMVLVFQSWSFRYQTTGVVAVPVSVAGEGGQVNPNAMTYTTRYGDPTRRVLVVMLGPSAPLVLPLEGLPRWNDSAGEQMPKIKLHDDARLAAAVGFGTRITTVGYVADGTLEVDANGRQSVTPTPASKRRGNALPYPGSSLLALKFVTDTEDNSTAETIVWLPFEPEGTDSLAPKNFYSIQGLGTLGLAFRPASVRLPFAMAFRSRDQPWEMSESASLYIADTHENRLTQPSEFHVTNFASAPIASALEYQASYVAHEAGKQQRYEMAWTGRSGTGMAYVSIKTTPASLFITAGLFTFVFGVVLDRLLGWLTPGPRRKRSSETDKQPGVDGAAA